ncbi:peptide-methionine (R)-S-oxide reductase [Rhodospirillum rubrum]|uniref:peptide-methionine (R)-S-oxide reductase MsrB n=1 Tax=Rhodospirillum rubrum TaxID=1085 RepID=UPI001905FA00|nr:peptide-methionine (R)-S-oxide reductase MsrB [Rhodospirillum rubrum]MBK1663673.1 peptide-methionine (R)-S-oxide reductase [Rhodospirillum rubrum]MBK1675991.1 peptide-methionine (R)-S-oxide reductase [Rhodospirillum rubrum]
MSSNPSQRSAPADFPPPAAKSDKDWRASLTEDQYRVMRHQGTEAAWSSALNGEKRSGAFLCAACQAPLFASGDKYDSGSGWPSFTRPADKQAVGTSVDHKLIVPRTEVHCSACGGHLGHVFEDGPRPTGLRYCINGVALDFKPEAPQATASQTPTDD